MFQLGDTQHDNTQQYQPPSNQYWVEQILSFHLHGNKKQQLALYL